MPASESPSKRIDARIKALGDWRSKTLARLRSLIKEADPGVVEEWKWSVPVWSHDGIICTGEMYKKADSSLEGNTRRAIDVRESDELDEKALKALIRAAVALNTKSR
jgi:hypothetical protein